MAGGDRRRADALAAATLAAGGTWAAAAEAAGISETTVGRRLRELAFRRQVAELRAAMVDQATGRAAAATTTAIDTLVELLSSMKPAVRLAAARALLEYAVRLREHGELDERLTALEAAAPAALHRAA